MPELPYYGSEESGLYGNRLPNLSTRDSTTTETDSPVNAGFTSPPGNSDGAKTHFSHGDKADSQPPTPVASQNTFYPGCIHIRADSNTIALWRPDAQERENSSVVPKAKTLQPTTPGSQVQSFPGYYQQLGCIPIADDNNPSTTLFWDLNSPEGEYTNFISNAEDGPPTSSKENQPLSFSPSISPTTSNAYASMSPNRRSCPTSPTSPISPTSSKRTRLRAQLASARQQRKSLDCDIARLGTALEMEEAHERGQWAALQGHLESQLQVAERQRERLVAQGERTEELDMEIEGMKEALGDIETNGGNGKRRRMNEGILRGRIVKREVIGEPERGG